MAVKTEKQKPRKRKKRWGEWDATRIPKRGIKQMSPLERKM